MTAKKTLPTLSREKILEGLIEILKDMTSDWDLDFSGELSSNTRLVEDLAFESIDMVQLIVAIEGKFKKRGMPYEEFLMVDGRYVDEILVGDIVEFLYRHLNS